MKAKRSRESAASRIFMLVFLAAAVVVGISPGEASKSSGGSLLGSVLTSKVKLAAGTFEPETQELTVILYDGETELLNQFTDLRYADFRGSTCQKEIAAWAQAHPEIQVIYDVTLPNGSRYENSAEAVDLSGTAHGDIENAVELLSCLPKVSRLELGVCGAEGGLSAEDALWLFDAYPDAQFVYSFSVCGQIIDANSTSLDLSGASHDELVEAAPLLQRMSGISTVNMGSEGGALSFEDVGFVQENCPNAAVDYRFQLFGREFSTLDETMDFWYVPMDDGGAAVRSVLPYMKNCSYVDMDSCGISNEDMAALQADFPDKKLVWRIWFGDNYSVRTDVERILASKPSVGGTLYNDDVSLFRYCTDLKYLDLGHNIEITDISFVQYTPKLEVLIIAMNNISDISPLAYCHNLEFLEIQTTKVADISPLEGITSLRHLNIGGLTELTDISPLFGTTELERLWVTTLTPIPPEQIEQMRQCAPNCNINVESDDPHGDAWRISQYVVEPVTEWIKPIYVERYILLREQLGYDGQWYAFYWTDPKCQKPCLPEYNGMYGISTD